MLITILSVWEVVPMHYILVMLISHNPVFMLMCYTANPAANIQSTAAASHNMLNMHVIFQNALASAEKINKCPWSRLPLGANQSANKSRVISHPPDKGGFPSQIIEVFWKMFLQLNTEINLWVLSCLCTKFVFLQIHLLPVHIISTKEIFLFWCA